MMYSVIWYNNKNYQTKFVICIIAFLKGDFDSALEIFDTQVRLILIIWSLILLYPQLKNRFVFTPKMWHKCDDEYENTIFKS